MALGLGCLMFSYITIVGYMFAWIAGIGFGMFIVTPSNALINYFGSAHFADISSSFGLISGLLCGFNSLIMGFLYDITGSTMIIWYISAAFVIIGFVLAFTMKVPRCIRQ